MVVYQCLNDECKYYKKKPSPGRWSTEKNVRLAKPPMCPHCHTPTQELKADTSFEGLAKKVQEKGGKNYSASYGKRVVDFLRADADGRKFQPDFMKEMTKDSEVVNFLAAQRPAQAYKICFDSAMKHAGLSLPPGCPTGEKFDFEIPYIMSTTTWTYLGLCQKKTTLFATSFADFCKAARENGQAGKEYFVAWHKAADSDIGHMICITLKNGAMGYIHDPQTLEFDYMAGVCEVWERPDTEGEREEPWCTLDLTSGVMGEFVGGKT